MLDRMSKEIHVRTEIDIPGAPRVIHVAEMIPLITTPGTTPVMCTLLRIIELSSSDDAETITGVGQFPGRSYGLAAEPHGTVPHPDSYSDFPDIQSKRVSSEVFEGLWMEGIAKFPDIISES